MQIALSGSSTVQMQYMWLETAQPFSRGMCMGRWIRLKESWIQVTTARIFVYCETMRSVSINLYRNVKEYIQFSFFITIQPLIDDCHICHLALRVGLAEAKGTLY